LVAADTAAKVLAPANRAPAADLARATGRDLADRPVAGTVQAEVLDLAAGPDLVGRGVATVGAAAEMEAEEDSDLAETRRDTTSTAGTHRADQA